MNSSNSTTFDYPIPTKQFIHGEYVDAKGTERLTLRSAINDSIVADDLCCANTADVELAVKSAEEAFKAWKSMPPEKRRSVMWKYADLIEANASQLGYLEAILVGKGVAFGAGWEPQTAAELFRYFAGFVDKNEGEAHSVDEDGFLRIVRNEPLGVCAAINAFNSPMITFAMKAAPALAAGNVIISKASEMNPFSTLFLGELAIRAGFPPGALNILVGSIEAGAALSSHMRIRKISFTGSVAVGKKVQIAATNSNLKRVTLELGGKSPVVIFDDADLSSAVQGAASFLSLNGQGCILGTRIYVQEGIAAQFLDALKVVVEGYGSTLGANPLESSTMSAPLYHARQKDSVLASIEQGKKEAQLITGGEAWGTEGCYVKPTIFFKPAAGAQILEKEIFGPVVVVDTFESEAEVLAKANASEYGLGAYLWTKDLDKALRLSSAIEAGTVTVNTAMSFHVTVPFGGYKSSGIGRENGRHVLKEYTQPKSVIIKFDHLA